MDFGARLRQAREQRGISLRQIASATKISPTALEALERNDISRLPGGIFTRAFVRSYALEVGLDPEQTVREFLASFPSETVTAGGPYAADRVEEDTFESQRRMASSLLWLFGLSLPVAIAIVYFSTRGPSDTAAPGVPDPQETPASSTRPAERPVASPSAPSANAPAAAPAAPLPTTLGLVLLPKGPCWVSVTVDGAVVLSRVLQPGEREARQAKEEILLEVGDAGALAYSINEAPGRPLGRPGEVVKVRITRDNYLSYVNR